MIENDRPADISGEDNLKTLQAVFAVNRSPAERRAVRPEVIEEEAKL